MNILPSRTSSAEPSRTWFTTQSLRDDEIHAIADATYRSDNPLRFESIRQAALMFERTGYVISRDPQISPLAPATQPIVAGNLIVDVLGRTVQLKDRAIELKPREFELLALLARHPGQVFRRTHLLELVWPRDFEGGDRTVDVHVARLRRHLGGTCSILTVHGVGYKLAAPSATLAA